MNKANLATLVKEYPSLLVIEEDVRLIEAFLETELGPETELEIQHQTLTSEILRQIQNQGEMTLLQSLIEQSALLRKSIG